MEFARRCAMIPKGKILRFIFFLVVGFNSYEGRCSEWLVD
jgi:hypothetical protein